MPCEKRDRIERLDELGGFLHQSFISPKNLARLKILIGHVNPEVAAQAALIREIGLVLPGKRKRWLNLARHHPPLFERAVELFGVEFFENLVADEDHFSGSPLWEALERYRTAPPWTACPCDCGSGLAFRNRCMERENQLADDEPEPPILEVPF